MKDKIILLSLVTLLLLTACSHQYDRTDSEKFMITSNVEYVKEFPQEINMSNPEKVDVNVVGITNFLIVDSVMAFTVKGEKGIMTFAETNNLKVLGKILNIGNAQDEMSLPPSLSTSCIFYTIKDSLFADLFDGQKGRLLTVNVSKSLAANKISITRIQKEGFSNDIFNIARLDEQTYMVKAISNGDTQQTRKIINLKSGKESVTPILEQLNTASVVPGEDFNILSTITKTSNDGRIIEMPIGLNYLNIYKTDGSIAKTICIGDKLADIDEIMSLDRGDRLYTFSDIRVFKKGFGVVQIDETEKQFQSDRTKFPSILFFSFEGKPLAKIDLKRQFTSFDVDFKNNYIYTFDSQSEEFLRYKIPAELAI